MAIKTPKVSSLTHLGKPASKQAHLPLPTHSLDNIVTRHTHPSSVHAAASMTFQKHAQAFSTGTKRFHGTCGGTPLLEH
jgi:hypothetical protein